VIAHPEMSRSKAEADTKPRRFSPGAIAYDGAIPASYRAGRALSSQTADAWRVAIQPFVRPARGSAILDLGSGTGRFARLLAHAVGAHVVGAEPSRGMLTLAARDQPPEGVVYVAASAESLPFRPQVFDVAWLSHVFHHVRDRPACARELRRVLRVGGCVLLRGTFGDRLDGFPTLFRFFPGARDICAELPTVTDAVAVFEREGFTSEAVRRVEQRTCGSLADFAARTRLRADTALALLSDREFAEGQATLEAAAAREQGPSPVVETLDLLVYRKSGGSAPTARRRSAPEVR